MARKAALMAIPILVVAACEPEGEGPGNIGLSVSAISDNCSGDAWGDPLGAVKRLVIRVTTPDRVVASKTFKPSDCKQGTCSILNVPASANNDVTLMGYTDGDAEDSPSWFGRRRQVPIFQDKVTGLDLVMTRFGQFTCVKPPTSFVQTMFPSVVRLGDGRILVAGGFTEAFEDVVTPGVIVLRKPSDLAFIYDPQTGAIAQAKNPMFTPRAGHTAVFVPIQGGSRVIMFGGTAEMTMKLDGKFPFSIANEDGLKTYEVFDVSSATFLEPGKDEMMVKRAFASGVLLSQNFVLVFGGGAWPKSVSAEYMKADIWSPSENGGKGGMQKLGDAAPVMNAAHNGAAIAKLDDTAQGLPRYVLAGGTPGKELVFELYTDSSRQDQGVGGVFKTLSIAKGPKPPSLYFPTLTALSGKQFLLAGGVPFDGTNFTSPVAKAWLVAVGANEALTVTELDTSGCPMARFFHTATASYERDKVTILGGFSTFSGIATGDACFFDLATQKVSAPDKSKGFAQFLPRAGHRTETMLDDTLIVVGGIVDKATMTSDHEGMLEVYTPPVVNLDLVVQVPK